MNTWWEFGDWSASYGDDPYGRLRCGFCPSVGRWTVVTKVQNSDPRSGKTLHFDTAKCANCGNHVLVFWTKPVMDNGLHAARQVPWPLDAKPSPSENWPPQAQNYWTQAKDNIGRRNWEAAIILARTALQCVARDKGAGGGTLQTEIDRLGAKGVLPPNMVEWAHTVIRDTGNDFTHPTPDQAPAQEKEARQVVGYLEFVLEYVYDLPKRIESFRSSPENASTSEMRA